VKWGAPLNHFIGGAAQRVELKLKNNVEED
jgi:hypothetical protein